MIFRLSFYSCCVPQTLGLMRFTTEDFIQNDICYNSRVIWTASDFCYLQILRIQPCVRRLYNVSLL